MEKTQYNNAPIGVFDSGMGGLTVWRALRETMPEESLVFLGDGKNCPYGSRPPHEICELADRAVGRLVECGIKMIVVACNTATAAAIEFLREKYADIPIVGMEPAVKPAALNTKSRVIGVLATEMSLHGDLFHRTAARYASDVEVIAVAGSGFVEIVEQNREDTPEAEAIVRDAIGYMLERGADQIVLGCTHYPFLTQTIKRVVGERDVTIVDPSGAVARRAKQLLTEGGAKAEPNHTAEYTFLTFDNEEYLARLIARAGM